MRKENFFEKNDSLLEVHKKIIEKRSIEEDWDSFESDYALLPATPFRRLPKGIQPYAFSFHSVSVIVFMILTIIPALVFFYPVFKMYKKRDKILKRHRELQYEISSTFPRFFEQGRDHIDKTNGEEYRMLRDLIEEGVVIFSKNVEKDNGGKGEVQ